MVDREWHLAVQTPTAVPCLRIFYAKKFAAVGARLVSFKQIAFPHVAPYAAAYRGVAETASARFVFEFAELGKSRTEIVASVSGLSIARAWIASELLRLGRIVVARVQV
jgi:hypothetical protein